MKITGLIASTMLLLMASAPSGLLASPENGDFSIDVLDPLLDPYGRDWSLVFQMTLRSCFYPRRSGTCDKMFRRHMEESLHSFHLRISLILVLEYKRLSILQMDR